MSSKGLVLVTGANGFLASHVVKLLLEEGYGVRGTVRSTTGSKVQHLLDMGPRVELVAADLTSDDGWEAAAAGCDYCCHIAAAFKLVSEDEADAVLAPAVEGTHRVLRACAAANSVRRVVLTSSTAAIMNGWAPPPRDGQKLERPEETWSVAERCTPYARAKTLAERAAWDFVAQQKEASGACFELTVLNPGYIVGPPLSANAATSFEMAERMLLRKMPAVPWLAFAMVDVRDVARAHVAALTAPGAAGERIVCAAESLWCRELALAAHEVFAPLGYNVPTRAMPNVVLRVVALVDRSVRALLPQLGWKLHLDAAKSRELLSMRYGDARAAFIDMCHALLRLGLLPKTEAYEAWERAQQQQQGEGGGAAEAEAAETQAAEPVTVAV